MSNHQQAVGAFMDKVKATHPGEPEFHQSVFEVVNSIMPVYLQNPQYQEAKILERLVEPEKIYILPVTWENDKGQVHVNRGFRIQMNGAI